MSQDILRHPKTRFQPSAEAGFSFSDVSWHPLTSPSFDLVSTARRQSPGMNCELVFASGRIAQPELVTLDKTIPATPVQVNVGQAHAEPNHNRRIREFLKELDLTRNEKISPCLIKLRSKTYC